MPHTKQWGIQRSAALLSAKMYQIFNLLIHDAAKTLYLSIQLVPGSSYLDKDARAEQGCAPL